MKKCIFLSVISAFLFLFQASQGLNDFSDPYPWADASAGGKKAYFHAAATGDLVMIKRILKASSSDAVNTKNTWMDEKRNTQTGLPALWYAVGNQHNDLVKYLLAIPGIDVNVLNNGITPLEFAIGKVQYWSGKGNYSIKEKVSIESYPPQEKQKIINDFNAIIQMLKDAGAKAK